MSRLLRANFCRMLKSKTFWICLAIPLALDLLMLLIELLSRFPFCRPQIRLEPNIFGNAPSVVFLLSIFSGLFFGTEHSEGGLRNKLVVGHSRVTIYLANLIVCTTAGLTIFAADFIVNLALGLARKFTVASSWEEITVRLVIAVLAIAAVSALLVLIGTLFRTRSVGVVISICAYLALLVAGSLIMTKLMEPEYLPTVTVTYLNENDENGEPQTEEFTEKNPNYVGGMMRKYLESLNDILPVNQLLRLPSGGFENSAALPGYSAGIVFLLTAAGTLSFRKSDLK